MHGTGVQFLSQEDVLEKGMSNPLQWGLFLPRESHEQRGLVGYSPRSCKELDMTE